MCYKVYCSNFNLLKSEERRWVAGRTGDGILNFLEISFYVMCISSCKCSNDTQKIIIIKKMFQWYANSCACEAETYGTWWKQRAVETFKLLFLLAIGFLLVTVKHKGKWFWRHWEALTEGDQRRQQGVLFMPLGSYKMIFWGSIRNCI